MVALWAREAEEPLLEIRIPLVPEREGEAQPRVPVSDPEQAVLTPPIRAAARVIVREVIPAAAVFGVVLADGAPLTLGQERAPPRPVLLAARVARDAVTFGTWRLGHR